MAKFTAKPNLSVDIVATNDEGATTTTQVKEGVILQDCTFKEGANVVTKTGKITDIMVTTKKLVNDYSVCPCRLESQFDGVVTVDGFVLDASSVYGADVSMVFIKDLKSIGGVVEGTTVVDVATAEPGQIAAAIAALQPGQELVLSGAAEITEDIVIPAGAVIRGANAGVSAAKGYRAQGGTIEGETVISGTITATGSNVVLDGLTLTGRALPRIGDATAPAAEGAAAGKDVIFTLTNCRVVGLDDGLGAKKQYGIMPTNWNDNVEMHIENCYFGANAPAMYNLMELNCNLQSGSTFSNNYFAKGAFGNNAICLYKVANGAFVNVENNVFEYSCNAMRVGPKGNVTCTINVKNNTYLETCEPTLDSEGNVTVNWGGFFLVQPYGTATESMKNVTINVTKLNAPESDKQRWYYFANTSDTQLEVENRPKVFVDGVQESYEGRTYIL